MGPPRPPARTVQVGAQHGDRLQRQPLYGGGRVRTPGAEIQADQLTLVLRWPRSGPRRMAAITERAPSSFETPGSANASPGSSDRMSLFRSGSDSPSMR